MTTSKTFELPIKLEGIYTYRLTIGNPIGNLYRKNHTLILCKQGDKFLLGQKANFYPEGVARMLGGGLNENEDPTLAALREIQEETGIVLQESDLQKVATVRTEASTNEGEMSMLTYIFYCQIDTNQKLIPSDDISGIAYLSLSELENLIQKMLVLQGTHYGKGFSFEWRDYGIIYGYHHLLALKWWKNQFIK